MLGIGPIGAFLVGTLVVASASPVIVASAVERPQPRSASRAAVIVAAAWCAAFLAATVLDLAAHDSLAVAGMLFAAAELSGAAAVWLARSRRHHGGGGWDDGPDDPPGGGVPEDYWRFWESDLANRPLQRR